MHLKEFSLVSPKIQSTEIFKAIEVAIPATSIEQAIGANFKSNCLTKDAKFSCVATVT
ncbi:hypothetical protein COO91_10151 (plasmid) [Nostoc flagelliforme CCNUN1]|uniref:Uncharacterized protein n=1 Tax=Nostoc flagelliforme CCNUN1 TaxID=2038116 RepID=A0A2K8T8A8_9NOSO|nr:hypothetical protein COO91_10151 [Nostoc flagelliforme CCNUN1]